MPFVTSRVNGLKIAIPADARNIVHRFAIGGGGNELVFEPIKRADFERSQAAENRPLAMGTTEGAQAPTNEPVALTTNIAEEDEKPKRTRRSRAKSVEAQDTEALSETVVDDDQTEIL